MQQASNLTPSGMVSIIGLERDTTLQLCKEVSFSTSQQITIGNYLSASNYVVSGGDDACKQMIGLAKQHKAKLVRRLPVSGAFHTSYMNEALSNYQEMLRQITIKCDMECGGGGHGQQCPPISAPFPNDSPVDTICITSPIQESLPINVYSNYTGEVYYGNRASSVPVDDKTNGDSPCGTAITNYNNNNNHNSSTNNLHYISNCKVKYQICHNLLHQVNHPVLWEDILNKMLLSNNSIVSSKESCDDVCKKQGAVSDGALPHVTVVEIGPGSVTSDIIKRQYVPQNPNILIRKI